MNDYYECEITVKLQDTLGKVDTANKKGFNQTGSTVANEVYPVYNDFRSSHKLRCW